MLNIGKNEMLLFSRISTICVTVRVLFYSEICLCSSVVPYVIGS